MVSFYGSSTQEVLGALFGRPCEGFSIIESERNVKDIEQVKEPQVTV